MSQSKEELLLHAALKLFNELGFHGTSTAKITKEAGVSTGTLYNYFESKEVLINSLYIYVKTDLSQYIERNVIQNDRVENTIESIWSGLIKWAIEHPDYYKFKEAFYQSPYIEAICHEKVKEINHSMYTIVEQIFTNKNIPLNDIAFISEFFIGALNATINYIQKSEIEDVDKAIDKGFQYLWTGVLSNND